MSSMTILGEVVEDELTGFKGVAVARIEYLNGCISVEIQPKALGKDGTPIESKWFDEQRICMTSTATAGGPGSRPPGLSIP